MCKYFLFKTTLYSVFNSMVYLSFISGGMLSGSLLFSDNALANTQTVYICERGNETLMQDTKPTGCEHLKTVQIKINTEENISQPPARLDENARYDDRYGNYHVRASIPKNILIEDKVHNRLLQQSQDDYYVNQCFWYDSKIQNELLEIDRRPEDALEVRQIMAQIPKDKAQYEYYCNQPYSDK